MSHNIQTIDTDTGTLVIDMATGENVVINEHNPELSHIDHPDGTLVLDHSTRESVIIEDSTDLSESSDSESPGIQA